ncbi:hypothetical protein P3S67_032156 [Capsicum chacoense]
MRQFGASPIQVFTAMVTSCFCKICLKKGVCNELFISTREGSCCANTQNKCWRHFLKDFMIKEVVIDEKEEAKTFRFVFTWQLFS